MKLHKMRACLAIWFAITVVTHAFYTHRLINSRFPAITWAETEKTASGGDDSGGTEVDGQAKPKDRHKSGKTKKEKPKKLSARERTGYKYKDEEGMYDVPIIDEPMWYRLTVRKASEKRLTEAFNELAKSEKWGHIIEEAFYPSSSYVRFKGKVLDLGSRPMVPGLVYLKTRMSPDIADDLEQVQGIYGFSKNQYGIVVPMTGGDAEQIENLKLRQVKALPPELLKMKKEEYVTVVEGPHKGKYGILMGAKKGRLEVCLRSDYRDEWDLFNVDELRYLAEPPEKKWKTMSAKEAVESLMSKDPRNPTIKSLRDQGLLEEILYPDGRPMHEDRDGEGGWNNNNNRDRFQGGREGGARVRSIAKDAHTVQNAPQRQRNFDSWTPKSHRGGRRGEGTGGWRGSDDGDMAAREWTSTPHSSSAAGSFGRNSAAASNAAMNSGEAGEDGDFDAFIEDLLNDFDDKSDQLGSTDARSSAASTSASSPHSNARSGSDSDDDSARDSQSLAERDDRSDSERILDELLLDLDGGRGGSAGGKSANTRSGESSWKSSSSAARKGSKTNANTKRTVRKSATVTADAPQMKDFGSFEEYLDALVSHEQGGGAPPAPSRADASASSHRNRMGTDSSARGRGDDDYGEEDSDDLLRLLEEEDLQEKRQISLSSESDEGSTQNHHTEEPSFEDDLEAFLDSLDDLGMDPPAEKPSEARPATKKSITDGGGLSKKTVPELKILLKERGLPISGKKAELIERLGG